MVSLGSSLFLRELDWRRVLNLLANYSEGLTSPMGRIDNYNRVESLQSHCLHTQFHWSSGPPVCFLSWGTRVQSPGGYLCETGILLLALSRYIGDSDVIDHCGLVWGRLWPEPSLGCCADNVIIQLDLTQLFCPCFTLAAGPPFGFTKHSRLLGGSPVESLQSYSILTQSRWSGGSTLCFPSWGNGVRSQGGYLCETGILLLALSCYNFINLWK